MSEPIGSIVEDASGPAVNPDDPPAYKQAEYLAGCMSLVTIGFMIIVGTILTLLYL